MKRHASLLSLARDHHHALVMSQALRRDAPARLRAAYPEAPEALVERVRARFDAELEPHFLVEERELLPRCEAASEALQAHAKRVAEDHEALRRMVRSLAADPTLAQQLDAFATRLEAHVRFEDREWFPALEDELGDTLATTLAGAH